jgi:hypothetical protein
MNIIIFNIVIKLQKKSEKILFLCLIGILLIISTSEIYFRNVQTNISESPKSSPVFSSLIIRPNDDYVNPHWISNPIFEKIDDAVTLPTVGGDSDSVEANEVGDWCEVRMGDISLQSNQVITRIRIHARGKQNSLGLNSQRVDFSWRIGSSGTYSTVENLKFDETSFYWQSTSFWDNLDLNEAEINALQIRLEIGGTTHYEPGQAISVMYVELTIKTNNDPSVTLSSPNGGEILNDSALIEWSYNDPEGDSVSFDLFYRLDGGSWTPIIIDLVEQTSHLWNLSAFSQTYNTVELLIEASDGDTGYANDTSDGPFVIKVNRNPTVNLIYPTGGENLHGVVKIQWNYFDPDGDTLYFNLYYNSGGTGWQSIVTGLVNETSYDWVLKSFNSTLINVTIRIKVTDGYGGINEDYSGDPITIRKYQPPLNSDPLTLFLILGVSTICLGTIITGLFIRKRRQKSKQTNEKIKPKKIKYKD